MIVIHDLVQVHLLVVLHLEVLEEVDEEVAEEVNEIVETQTFSLPDWSIVVGEIAICKLNDKYGLIMSLIAKTSGEK